MKMRRWFDPVGLIQQLANRDLRFARIVFPFGDGVRDAIVEADQAVAHSAKRGDPPEALRAAKNLATQIGPAAIGVMFENGPAILHDQNGEAAFAVGIFGGARAIAGLNVGK